MHRGYWFHTIGQRKGLGLSGGPWYVVRKNIRDNIVYVSQGYDTDKQYGNKICLTEMHYITKNPWGELDSPIEICFKNRHSPEFNKATLQKTGDDEYIVTTQNKIQGIAPGQFGVIYDINARICYGSGIITGRKL